MCEMNTLGMVSASEGGGTCVVYMVGTAVVSTEYEARPFHARGSLVGVLNIANHSV